LSLPPEQQALFQKPRTILIFTDSQTTALMESEDGKALYQRYSNDPEVKAADIDQFRGQTDSTASSILAGATLTDKTGQPLDADAKVALKTTGTYDVYARYSGKPAPKTMYRAVATS